ncbi:pickpocket protein 28-like [Leptidea sinapis]|uniref:pickpocket protein 28-like n=1 Tax=Leptidea sinapis TaxID=189913 RepID=UPI0021C37B62|nr:pickpocket protein 28-like [Leptidea sinapis]
MTEGESKLMLEFIVKGSPKCEEMVKFCHWRPALNTEWHSVDCCEKFFKPVLTEYGLCYAFNNLPLGGMTNNTLEWQKTFNDNKTSTTTTEWSLDEGYPKVFPPVAGMIPYRVMASGEANGVSMELYLNTSDHQYDCDGHFMGFNILIRSPTDHVYSTTILRLPMDKMTTIEVTPTTYKTDASLRALLPDLRQCFFQNERKLQYFEFYTDSNCQQDLLMRETMEKCKCVMYNWPKTSALEPTCSTEDDFFCIKNVKEVVEQLLIYAYYKDSDEQRQHHQASSSCYPSCNDVLYSSQVYYSDLGKQRRDDKMDRKEFQKGERTNLNIHFYNDMFLGQHRHAQYDDYYFAGAIGGLFSLFLGFSIISVAEIVYFVIFKPIYLAFRDIFMKTI